MPKFDFSDQIIPDNLKLPEKVIELDENMTDDEIEMYITQELVKIYNSNSNSLIKEMKKEDLYDEIIDRTNYSDNYGY